MCWVSKLSQGDSVRLLDLDHIGILQKLSISDNIHKIEFGKSFVEYSGKKCDRVYSSVPNNKWIKGKL